MFELACFPDFPKPRVVLCGRMDFSVILRSWSATPETVDEGSAHFPSEIIVQRKISLCIYTIYTLTKHKLDGYNSTGISSNRKKWQDTTRLWYSFISSPTFFHFATTFSAPIIPNHHNQYIRNVYKGIQVFT